MKSGSRKAARLRDSSQWNVTTLVMNVCRCNPFYISVIVYETHSTGREPVGGAIMKAFRTVFVAVLLLASKVSGFAAPSLVDASLDSIKTNSVVRKVAVAGATGRTGRLVVQQLLDRGVEQVVALVRDETKAADVFPNPPKNLQLLKCDLGKEDEIQAALTDVDAAIWCATGFSDARTSLVERMKRLLGYAVVPKRSIDYVGVPAFGKYMSTKSGVNGEALLPKVVMLSSAGVTRPSWDEDKKKMLVGAADIPIVRLNPFGILDVKRESEEKLRETGVNYCIVRPAGLNDKWPAGSRPVLSQGDVAVGRINRKDVADLLVDVLSAPEATGKTFEAVGLAGYAKAKSIRLALSRLEQDSGGPLALETVKATYLTMQQLVPGETQTPAALAMGQTYEELDTGRTGRLGVRGQENAEAAMPKPSV